MRGLLFTGVQGPRGDPVNSVRTGTYCGHGSGDILLALSAASDPLEPRKQPWIRPFIAAGEVNEEAVVNALACGT